MFVFSNNMLYFYERQKFLTSEMANVTLAHPLHFKSVFGLVQAKKLRHLPNSSDIKYHFHSSPMPPFHHAEKSKT